jgi:NarL family two-component system response regulator LiaR
MTDPIRVLVVDDHPVVTGGLAAMLFATEGLELAGTARSAEEAIVLCNQTSPDVVLMDLVMPGTDGIVAIETIRQRCPQTHVIALTSFRESDLVQAALKAGAIGYLLKNATAAELVAAIRAACEGQSTLSPEVTQVLVQSTVNPPQKPDLTKRELDVLALIIQGLTNNQIADKLNISLSTVQFHVGNILSKLGVSSRVQAAVLAERYNLLSQTGQ